MFQVNRKHSYVDLFEGILIGGTIAAAATFIFGTKKGKELQKELVHQYKKLSHTTKTMRHKIEKAIKTQTAKKAKVKKALKKVKSKIKAKKRR
jgi:gas vesicle protein